MNNENNLSNEEKEKLASDKAGQTIVRGGLDALTGGAYGKAMSTAEKIPIAGKRAKKKEEKLGKKVSKALNKRTDGNFGKVAKELDDNGGLDAINKAQNIKSPEKLDSKDVAQTKPNFAKNGLNSNGNQIVDNGGTSKNTKGIRDIFDRKKNSDAVDTNSSSSSSSDSNSFFSRNSTKNSSAVVNVFLKKVVKMVIIPFIAGFLFLMLFVVLLTSSGQDNDLEAVDSDNDPSTSTSYFANGNRDMTSFYNLVLEIEKEYKDDGKSINPMYITATYHVLKEYDAKVSVRELDKNTIKTWCEGMLGGSTVYSEDTYKEYLRTTLFPSYGFNSNLSSKATIRVFEYINAYLKKKKKDNTCTTTSGSSCVYNLKDGGGNTLNLDNLQVRLMSTSCSGGNFGALKEDLVPFEKYILGVGYAEIGTGFNKEAEKVQLIAARSFSLNRPYSMGGSNDVKFVNSNNKNILQMRSCVADQVFCNTDKGCSKDSTDQWNVMYSGTTHSYVYRQSLDNYPSSTLKSSWEDTMGVVGVSDDGRVVTMGYTSVNQNRWNSLANSGMDYKQIILSEYPAVKELRKADCSSSKKTTDVALVQVAQKVWREIANGNYSYYMDGLSVPPPKGLVDCSTFISWILYEYGFQEEFGGPQHNTVAFLTTDWTKNGWTEIPVSPGENVVNKLQPGDILVRDTGSGGANGHVNIVDHVQDGRVYVYDAGSQDNWLTASAKAGMPIENTNFAKSDSRGGKIIRINSVGGNSCTTVESGEVTSWRQTSDKWGSVRLGNSNKTIASVGCFVTSIAIQIERSKAKTNLSQFNPGTFVQALNKNKSSFSSDGSFTASDNIVREIVPSFTTIGKFSLPSSKKEKIDTIKSYLDQGYYVILQVKGGTGSHWVAVTGVNNNNIQMIDPGSEGLNVWDKYPVNGSTEINVYKIG